MENNDSNIMPSSNNKELEVHIHMSCKSKMSFRELSLCMAADQRGHSVPGGRRSVPT